MSISEVFYPYEFKRGDGLIQGSCHVDTNTLPRYSDTSTTTRHGWLDRFYCVLENLTWDFVQCSPLGWTTGFRDSPFSSISYFYIFTLSTRRFYEAVSGHFQLRSLKPLHSCSYHQTVYLRRALFNMITIFSNWLASTDYLSDWQLKNARKSQRRYKTQADDSHRKVTNDETNRRIEIFQTLGELQGPWQDSDKVF